MVRYRIAFVAMLAVMAIPIGALAGGWAMTSFEDVPGEFQAGSTYDLNYTILQHGQTPVDAGASQLHIIDSKGTVTVFAAVSTGDPGRYSVSITFPESGSWQWAVDQGDFGLYEIGTIDVAPAPSAIATPGPARRWVLPVSLVLVVGLVAFQLANLRKVRPASRPIRAG